MDKTMLEYRGDKNSTALDRNAYSSPGRAFYQRRDEYGVYQGIYIKETDLISGRDSWNIRSMSGEKAGAVLVKEGRTCCDPERAGRENSRFACLNQMSEAVAKQDAEGLLGAMEDYVKRSAALGILFPVN